jgi:hypothetical protein
MLLRSSFPNSSKSLRRGCLLTTLIASSHTPKEDGSETQEVKAMNYTELQPTDGTSTYGESRSSRLTNTGPFNGRMKTTAR